MNLPAHGISFREALRVWCRVAALSFGGPAGQIAVMHRILVEEKKWISENRFLHALNYCMLLPGPEAQQLATYIGWLLHGTRGGLAAGTLFILPGFVAIMILGILYAQFHGTNMIEALFFGLKPAVLALVIEAVFRIGRRALKNRVMVAIAAAAFVAIFAFDVPFPAIVIAAGVIGYIGGKKHPSTFIVIKFHEAKSDAEAVIADHHLSTVNPGLGRAVRVAATWLFLWWAPVGLIALFAGTDNVFFDVSIFFSKLACITFGGAYAVLAYMAQEAVHSWKWLTAGEMLDGLGMAETTPGPLIMVVQFVAFMGAWRNPMGFDPLVAGALGATLAVWVTFTPCFLWIFLGAPYIERLRGNQNLTAALSAITAAVVGVILNLSIWFALHVLFGTVNVFETGPIKLHVPDLSTIQWTQLAIAVAAFIALFRFKLPMGWLIAGSVIVGASVFLLV